jgi:hypothetical protein
VRPGWPEDDDPAPTERATMVLCLVLLALLAVAGVVVLATLGEL